MAAKVKIILVCSFAVFLFLGLQSQKSKPKYGNASFMMTPEEYNRIREEVKKTPTNMDNFKERYYALLSWGIDLWNNGYGTQYNGSRERGEKSYKHRSIRNRDMEVTFDQLEARRDYLFHDIDNYFTDFERFAANLPKPNMLWGEVKLPEKYGEPAMRNLSIDASNEIGRIRNQRGMHGSPVPLVSTDYSPFNEYKEADFKLIRVGHDEQRLNLTHIFPYSHRIDADPMDPGEYVFNELDKHIKATIDVGAEPYLNVEMDIGPAIYPGGDRRTPPPLDYKKWGEVCRQVVRHYNDGWANGYHYNIKYVLIWNEPDSRVFFAGTPQQYYELYAVAAPIIKEAGPNIKVGGPAVTNMNDRCFTYTENFLKYVTALGAPVDFLDWHNYGHHVNYDIARVLRLIERSQSLLDKYNLHDTENIMGEFSIQVFPTILLEGPVSAAYSAAVHIYAQDYNLEAILHFRGTGVHHISGYEGANDLGNCVYTSEGRARPIHYSYKALAEINNNTPIRLETEGGDTKGFAILAGKSENGNEVNILVTDYNSQATGYNLSVSNLPWGRSDQYQVETYVIDDDHLLDLVSSEKMTGNQFNKKINKTSPYVYLIKLIRQ